MEKLKQWVCDICGELIECPEDGYVVWKIDSNNKEHGFKILHQHRKDEHGKIVGCDKNRKEYPLSSHLPDFLGENGLVNLLSFLDIGGIHSPDHVHTRIKDLREFIEFFRRLQLPYYEEARLYWNKAISDGYFCGANEVWIYLPSTLREIIEKYKN